MHSGSIEVLSTLLNEVKNREAEWLSDILQATKPKTEGVIQVRIRLNVDSIIQNLNNLVWTCLTLR